MPDTTVTTDRGPLPAHLAEPLAALHPPPWPGVVVVHEAFGLNDDTRQHADRLATAGFLVLAPDLLAWGSRVRCVQAAFRALRDGHGRAYDDLEAARRALVARDDCTGRVGVVGFCLGGGFALMTAARGFHAAAPAYGLLPRDLDGALSGACPVVASYGGRDRGLRGAARRLEDALTRAGVEHDVAEYPDAGHSFMNRPDVGPFRPVLRVAGLGYHHPSAEDAWRRVLGFLDAHLREERGEAPAPAAG